MDSFTPARKIKKLPTVRSYAASACGHCPMDILMEELCAFPDVNALVVGVGECVYYAAKQPFQAGCRSWGFSLGDNEIVFGDTSALEEALDQIGDNGLTTVCIMTCIPSIMDLDLESVVKSRERTVLVKAPDYTAICPTDILSELYLQLGKKLSLHGEKDQTWDQVESIAQLREKLTWGVHRVDDRRFLDMLRQLAGDGVELLDNTSFQPLAFYEEHRELLGIHPDELEEAGAILQRLRDSGKTFDIKSSCAVSLANFLHSEQIPVAYAVTDGADRYTYAQCAKAPEELYVSFDFSTPLPEGNALVFHTQGQRQDFGLLLALLREVDGLWA